MTVKMRILFCLLALFIFGCSSPTGAKSINGLITETTEKIKSNDFDGYYELVAPSEESSSVKEQFRSSSKDNFTYFINQVGDQRSGLKLSRLVPEKPIAFQSEWRESIMDPPAYSKQVEVHFKSGDSEFMVVIPYIEKRGSGFFLGGTGFEAN